MMRAPLSFASNPTNTIATAPRPFHPQQLTATANPSSSRRRRRVDVTAASRRDAAAAAPSPIPAPSPPPPFPSCQFSPPANPLPHPVASATAAEAPPLRARIRRAARRRWCRGATAACSPWLSTLFSVPLRSCVSRRGGVGPVSELAVTVEVGFVAGVDEAVAGFVTGNRKATEVAHAVWRSIVQKGDTVVDATCGNGNDTLALLKMVADERGQGRVYGMDIQDSAIESTSSFLKMAVNDDSERDLVKLFPICHSKMEEIVPKDYPVRLVAFNLGYLPGGDKTLITVPRTTELALQAASRIIGSGGLISVLVYIGHPGGRG
ncbi:hypothetical protein ACP70R_035650 [Stipagrostis hirtigluma subsp. patula]